MKWYQFKKREVGELRSGVLALGGIVLALLTFGFLIVGVGLLRFPKSFETWPWLQSSPYFYGPVLIIVCSIVLWLMSERWSQLLPWFFGVTCLRALFGGIIGIASGRPHRGVPPFEAFLIAGVMFFFSVLTNKMVARRLDRWDVVAIMMVYYALAWSVSAPRDTFLAPVLALFPLAFVALIRQRAKPRRRAAPTFE
jgi:hypothetical protein